MSTPQFRPVLIPDSIYIPLLEEAVQDERVTLTDVRREEDGTHTIQFFPAMGGDPVRRAVSPAIAQRARDLMLD